MTKSALEKLTAQDSAPRRALVRLSIDHALARRIDEVIDPEATVRVVVDALTAANAEWLLTTHLRPGWDRHEARVTASAETIGAALPPGTKERILTLAAHTELDGAWTVGIVDRALLGKLLAPVVQEFLLSFTKRLPIPGLSGGGAGGGKSGGLGGAFLGGLAGQASKLVDVGKAVAGGIGAEMEKKMREAAKDFATDALDELRTALRTRLTSDEGKAILRELVSKGYDKVGTVKVADVMKDADRAPRAEVDALVASVVAHNGERDAVRVAIADEVRTLVATHGGRTIRSVTDELGLTSSVVALLEARADEIAKGFFATPEFAEWFGELYTAAP